MARTDVVVTVVGGGGGRAIVGPLGGGLGLRIFVLLRKGLTRTKRSRRSVLAGVSILYGLAFALIPWWRAW